MEFTLIYELVQLARRKCVDDDPVARLSNRVSVFLLIFGSILVNTRYYVGRPITCWTPQEFTRAWSQYAESYCFVQNTYYVPPDLHLPKHTADRTAAELTHYQWIPLSFLLMALLFYVPKMVWRLFNWHSGFEMQLILQTMLRSRSLTKANKSDFIHSLVDHIERALLNTVYRRSSARRFCMTHYLTTLYFIVKCLYVVNIVLQGLFIGWLLGVDYTLYGVDWLQHHFVFSGGSEFTPQQEVFPLVSMCDIFVREFGQSGITPSKYTIQCVLSVNLFYQKIFLLLWFWLALLLLVSSGSLIYWSVAIRLPLRWRCQQVRHWLHWKTGQWDNEEALLRVFVRDWLQFDGCFVLLLVECNVDVGAAEELAMALWLRFRPTLYSVEYLDKGNYV